MVVTLPRDLDEAAAADRALAAGVRVYTLGNYCTGGSGDRPPALVLGYGPVTPAQIEHGVRLLADAVRAYVRSRVRRSTVSCPGLLDSTCTTVRSDGARTTVSTNTSPRSSR